LKSLSLMRNVQKLKIYRVLFFQLLFSLEDFLNQKNICSLCYILCDHICICIRIYLVVMTSPPFGSHSAHFVRLTNVCSLTHRPPPSTWPSRLSPSWSQRRPPTRTRWSGHGCRTTITDTTAPGTASNRLGGTSACEVSIRAWCPTWSTSRPTSAWSCWSGRSWPARWSISTRSSNLESDREFKLST